MNQELSYPKHEHPHGINDVPPNKSRIWVCEECKHIFTDDEIRDDKGWGHCCKNHPCKKDQRCESHLEPYVPAILSHFQDGAGLTDEEIRAIKYCHLDADLQCTSHESDCELCKDRAISNAATAKARLVFEAEKQAAIKAERERILRIAFERGLLLKDEVTILDATLDFPESLKKE